MNSHVKINFVAITKGEPPLPSRPVAAFDLTTFLRKVSKKQKGLAVSLSVGSLSASHNVVVFSNQAGLYDSYKIKDFLEFCELLLDDLGINIVLLAATKYDFLRKPCPGMWKHYINEFGLDNTINSFFVGDAAGRPHDHSSADIKFALNCGIEFLTPETFFDDKKQQIPKSLDYSPHSLMQSRIIKNMPGLENGTVYIVIGQPRIGKTTFLKYLQPTGVFSNIAEVPTEIPAHSPPFFVDGDYYNVFTRAPAVVALKKFGHKVGAIYFPCDNFTEWSHLYMYFSLKYNLPIENEALREKIYGRLAKPRSTEGFDFILNVSEYLVEYDKEIGHWYLI